MGCHPPFCYSGRGVCRSEVALNRMVLSGVGAVFNRTWPRCGRGFVRLKQHLRRSSLSNSRGRVWWPEASRDIGVVRGIRGLKPEDNGEVIT
jgi:hypothetical protein